MQISFKHLASGSIALLLSSLVATLSVVPLTRVNGLSASAATVDFDADADAYDTWDGVSYDFSWYGDGTAESYEIGTAAQLASLSILTNDLSSAEWESITQNITQEDQQYIALVDSFRDKTITLTADIDLGNFDWMPISYPWRTPNLSSSYEFVNTAGDTVIYNAVDYVPELETVDPWVGDENGDPISTRYWEFPESEMRFRDLVMPVNFDKMNELVDGNIKMDRSLYVSVQGIATHDKMGAFGGSYYMYPYGVEDVPNYAYTYVKPRDYDWDIIKSYTYKDISGYTEVEPFSGAIDGAEHRVKGLAPSTPWTDDTEQRLHTYDPLAKGFVSQLGEDGSITNINVQGSYENDIMSYSAILCAYNRGLIDSCHIDSAEISQALITMIYPTRRDYSPNHDSVYEYSEVPGTVMPVGNSGIISSQNYGTISNCTTSGTVTQAFRQFGCVSCTNYGTIQNCSNYATVDSYTVQTDFTTDEWSYNNEYVGVTLNPNFEERNDFSLSLTKEAKERYTNKFGDLNDIGSQYITPMDTMLFRRTFNSKYDYDRFKNMGYMNSALDETMLLTCSNLYKGEIDQAISEGDESWWLVGVITHASPNAKVTQLVAGGSAPRITEGDTTWLTDGERHEGSMQDELLWLPGLYRTNEGESIAANHLYGNYEIAALGGICAVNEGTIANCDNCGELTALRNITEQSAHGRYRHSEEEIAKQDYYSYIRPTNQYGIFNTVVNTVSYAGGICAFNSGTVYGCGNTAVISTPDEYEEKRWDTEPEKTLTDHRYEFFDYIDYIPATLNNFYQNSILIGDKVADLNSCSLYANAWWVTEEWLEENALDGRLSGNYFVEDREISYDLDVATYFDRNMPYPFTFRYVVSQIGISSGIACTNIGSVHSIRTSGEAQDSVVSVSDGMDSVIDIYNVETTSTSRAFRNLTNTALNDISVEGADSFAVNILQRGDVQVDSSYIYIIDTTDEKPEIVLIEGDNADLFTFSQVSFKKTEESKGAPLAKNITRATITELINQSSYGSPGYMDTVTLSNYYVADGNGINKLLEGTNNTISNVFANVAFASDICDLQESSVTNLNVYSKGATPAGMYFGCNLEHIRIFGDNATMYCVDCDITDFISVGDIDKTSRAHSYYNGTGVTDYVYYFMDCSASDMYLESEIDYTLIGLNQSGFSYNTVPGVVSVINNTDTFEHCSINAPDGVLSYSYPNHLILDEVNQTYGIIYSDHAARDGAMAYALSVDDRRFTVAGKDIVNQSEAWLEFGLSELLDRCAYATEEFALPVYTRECTNDDEQVYHKLSIPYVSYGVGELSASREENGERYATHAAGELFPHTDIFAKSGEVIKLHIEAEDGYALSGVSEFIGENERKIPTEGAHDEPYTISEYTMSSSDVVLMGDWADVFEIEVDSSVINILDIVPNASAAVKGQQITVSGILKDDSWTVQNFYYIPYKIDGSNRRVLDPENMVVIGDTAKFIMPDAPVKIFASLLNNVAGIQRFVVSGQEATISGNNVDLYFTNSIDIADLEVDLFVISDGASISPDPLIVHDFSSPVLFTVVSESGYQENTFVVTVHTVADGTIQKFQILGYNGIINGSDITVNIPQDLDVSSVRPYVIWSGAYIQPDLTHTFNFDAPVEFKVGASDGSSTIYTVTTVRTNAEAEALQVFEVEGAVSLIDHINHKIFIGYSYGMDVSDILLSRLEYIGDSCNFTVGSRINLTQANRLSIVDAGGNIVSYDIVASEANPDMLGITQFNIFGYDGVIDQTNQSIAVTLPSYLDITNVAPYMIAFLGSELSPSATIKQDFSKPVEYTVTSFTGDTITYVVTVN